MQAFAMIGGEPIHCIYNELHADYLVVYTDDRLPCLCSVKHLEPTQPRWTTKALCSDGGLKTLFTRWEDLNRSVTCLLQTNSGLRSGATGPAALLRCSGDSDEAASIRKIWAPVLAEEFGASSAAVAKFLESLAIQDRLPDREHVRYVNLARLTSHAGSLGIPISSVEKAYDAAVHMVEAAGRNAGLKAKESLATVTGDLTPEHRDQTLRELKRVSETELRQAIASVDGHRGSSADSRLRVKLRRGGIGPVGVSRATTLRADWLAKSSEKSVGLPQTDVELRDIEREVLRLAHLAEQATRIPGAEYGEAMIFHLGEQLSSQQVVAPADILLGCAYELTDQCRIFWSDEFEFEEHDAVSP